MSQREPWDGEDRRKAAREEFVKAVICAIREEALTGGMSEEKHREQHLFIEEWIEEVKIKRERREKLKTQVMGWGIIAFLSSMGTGAYKAFLYIQEHWK